MDPHALSAHAHHRDEALHNKAGERRTRWVVGITALMMVGELVLGYMTGSVALTADGWHMGTHVGALGLTLVAYWYARSRSGNDVFSFGTGKIYALAGYTSGILLAVVSIMVAVDGIEHLIERHPVKFTEALPIAALGLVVNLVSAFLLSRDHSYAHGHAHQHGHHDGHAGHSHAGHSHAGHSHAGHSHAGHDHAPRVKPKAKPTAGSIDFNLRAAYIHILADTMTSVLAVVSLALGHYAGFWFLDPITGIVAAVVIMWWTFGLCRQAMRQLLDVVSSPAHEAIVRERLEAIDDVRVSDLHVWELGPGRRSCIVAIVTATPRDLGYYRDVILQGLEVAHLTIEIHQCGLPHAETHEPHDGPMAAVAAHHHE